MIYALLSKCYPHANPPSYVLVYKQINLEVSRSWAVFNVAYYEQRIIGLSVSAQP